MSLDCSECVISWIRRFAAAAAARFGLKGGTSGPRLVLTLGVRSTDNSVGRDAVLLALSLLSRVAPWLRVSFRHAL